MDGATTNKENSGAEGGGKDGAIVAPAWHSTLGQETRNK